MSQYPSSHTPSVVTPPHPHRRHCPILERIERTLLFLPQYPVILSLLGDLSSYRGCFYDGERLNTMIQQVRFYFPNCAPGIDVGTTRLQNPAFRKTLQLS